MIRKKFIAIILGVFLVFMSGNLMAGEISDLADDIDDLLALVEKLKGKDSGESHPALYEYDHKNKIHRFDLGFITKIVEIVAPEKTERKRIYMQGGLGSTYMTEQGKYYENLYDMIQVLGYNPNMIGGGYGSYNSSWYNANRYNPTSNQQTPSYNYYDTSLNRN